MKRDVDVKTGILMTAVRDFSFCNFAQFSSKTSFAQFLFKDLYTLIEIGSDVTELLLNKSQYSLPLLTKGGPNVVERYCCTRSKYSLQTANTYA